MISTLLFPRHLAGVQILRLFIYSYIYIQTVIIGTKPLDVEFVKVYNNHIMVLYQEKYRTSHCIHKNESHKTFINCCIK